MPDASSPARHIVSERAPRFAELVKQLRAEALAPSALDSKTKALLLMALDIAFFARHNAQQTAEDARAQGATDMEIAGVLQELYWNAAAQRMATGIGAMAAAGQEYPTATTSDPGLDRLAPEAPAFVQALKEVRGTMAQSEVLPRRTRCLIAVALSIAQGYGDSARAAAERALSQGASEDDLVDVIKLTYISAGRQRLTIGAHLLT